MATWFEEFNDICRKNNAEITSGSQLALGIALTRIWNHWQHWRQCGEPDIHTLMLEPTPESDEALPHSEAE